jgi:phenylalanine-4-hydroxylase
MTADEQLSDEYRVSVGKVMAARKIYDDTVVASGAESGAALQAAEVLAGSIEQRNVMRERYDAHLYGRRDRS